PDMRRQVTEESLPRAPAFRNLDSPVHSAFEVLTVIPGQCNKGVGLREAPKSPYAWARVKAPEIPHLSFHRRHARQDRTCCLVERVLSDSDGVALGEGIEEGAKTRMAV